MKTKCETLKLSIAISMVTLIFFTAFFILNKYFENQIIEGDIHG